jgi:CheY-like chemotaxis protein/predicted regulator of Ras-like GTPase activity (Roadblock/LC7/MglB family)
MASVPRILTVDPYGNIPAQIRAAFELMDRYVTQIDVPSATVALEEFERGGIDVVIAAWEAGDDMQGWELVGRLREIDASVNVILLGNYGDMDMDEETLEQSPFIYLRRPFDIPQLLRVLKAALDDDDIFEAMRPPVTAGVQSIPDMGPVPKINEERAAEIVDELNRDVNPIATILATREGETVIEQGMTSDIDTRDLARTVVHAILANIDLRDFAGGDTSAMQFFDGDDYDIFLLSVGLHHFLILIFDGTSGTRMLGPVNNYGRKRVRELTEVLGAHAWIMQRRRTDTDDVLRRSQPRTATQEQAKPLARAQITSEVPAVTDDDETELMEVEAIELESNLPRLEAIADDEFDIDALFADGDDDSGEDLFSLDALEGLAGDFDAGDGSTIDWSQAEQLGLIGDD